MFGQVIASVPHALVIAALIASVVGLALLANPSARNLQDASLVLTAALPAAGSTTTTSATGLDTGITTPNGILAAELDLLLTAPALNTTQLPDGETITYTVVVSASASMSGATTLLQMGTQTGASGSGAAAITRREALPMRPGGRYVGFTATTSSGTGNCSAATATVAALF